MNRFTVEVLEDGRVKITSVGGFSQEIHASAEEYLEFMKKQLGGDWTTKKLKPSLLHPQLHTHSHGGQHHSH